MKINSTAGKSIILFAKQQGKCFYCGCNLLDEAIANKSLHIDHYIPKVDGGSNDIENLRLTCAFCNYSKNKKKPGDFMEYLQPYLQGLCSKKDIGKYNEYKKLKARFESFSTEYGQIDVDERTQIEYISLIERILELESAYQELRDILEGNEMQ